MANFYNLPPELQSVISSHVRKLLFKERVCKLARVYSPRRMWRRQTYWSIYWEHTEQIQLKSSLMQVQLAVYPGNDYMEICYLYHMFCTHSKHRGSYRTAWYVYEYKEDMDSSGYSGSKFSCNACI